MATRKKAKKAKKAKKTKTATPSIEKKNFFSKMSYELRTPLNSIMGFSDLIAKGMVGSVNRKQREYLQDILFSAKNLLQVVNKRLKGSVTKTRKRTK